MSIKQKFIDLVIRGKDLFSPSANKATDELRSLQGESREASAELKKLEKTQADLARARGLELYAEQAEKALAGARAEVTRLAREIDTNKTATKALSQNFSEAKKTANQAEKALAAASKEVTKLSKEMAGSGKSTSEQTKNLDAAKNSAKQAETALKDARSEVARLAREMDASGSSTKEQSENLSAARRSANQLQTEYNKLTGQLSRSKVELQQSGINTRNLASEQDRLQSEIKQSSEQVSAKRTRLAQLRTELNNTTKSAGLFGNSIGGLTTKLVAFAGAYVGLRSIKTAITDIFTAGDQFDRLAIQMTGVMGSIEAGEEATAWIQEFTKKTPLQLSEVTEAFVKLRNFGLDPMDGTLAKIIDMSEKLGGGWQKAEAISRALGEAWGKQRLQGQEILQLINAGVPVWELLEKVTGRNAGEVRKLSEAGKIGRDVMRDLIDEIGRAADGQAQKGMQTMTGLVSNLKDNITRFYVLIAESGAMDVLKEQLNSVNEQFERMAADGTLKAAADKLAEFIGSIVKTSGDGLNAMIANVSGIVRVLSGVSNTIKLIFNAVSAGIFVAASAFTKYVSLMLKSWGSLASFVGANNIADSLKEQAGAIDAVSKAFFDQFEQDAADIAAAWDGITKAVNDSSNSITANVVANSAQQVAANESVNQAQQERIAQQQKLDAAIANSGIVTMQSLKNIEEVSRETYEIIKAAAEEGALSVYEVEQAYLAWAAASLKVTEATKGVVPEVMRLEAAELGLGRALDDLIKKQGLSVEFSDQQGRSVSVLRQEVEKTKSAIELYQRVVASDTATLEEKRIATLKLVDAQQLLKGQLESLAEVEALRTKSYFEVKLALEEAKRQSDLLTQSYVAGTITTQQYNDQLERQLQIINALQGMLGGADDGTQRHGRQQQQTGEQVERTTGAVEKQSTALKSLATDTDQATKYTSLLAQAQQALQTQFDFSEKSTGDLNNRIDELTGYIGINRRVVNMWWVELARASNEAFTREQQIISETLTMRKYIEQLESGSLTMRQLNGISQQMNTQFSRLGANELEPLRRAITDAEQRLLSFRDGLQGTVQGLQDEIDRLNNNQAAIEQRRFEAQVAELQAKLKQAQETGDQQSVAAAQQALKLAKEIYQIKTAQFKAEQQANAQDAQPAKPKPRFATEPLSIPQGSIVSNSNSNTKTVRLVLDIGGNSYQADIENNDADRMLRQIERARSTSL